MLCHQLWALQTELSNVANSIAKSFTILNMTYIYLKLKKKKKRILIQNLRSSKGYVKSPPSLHRLSESSTHLNLYLNILRLYLRKNNYKLESWERHWNPPGSSSGRAGTKQHKQHLQWPIVRVKTNLPDWMSQGRDISVWSRSGRDTGVPGALSNSMLLCSRLNNRTMFTFPLVP